MLLDVAQAPVGIEKDTSWRVPHGIQAKCRVESDTQVTMQSVRGGLPR
jgi:hypothetical protein